MTQFARPTSDVTDSGITPSSNAFQNIDEATADDTDFAYGANGGGNTLEVALGSIGAPGAGTVTARVRLAKVNAGALSSSGNAVTVTVGLYEGATLRATIASAVSVGGSWAQTNYNLTSIEKSSITDWTNLRLRFTDSTNGGSPSGRRGGAISWAVIEAPDASINTTVTPSTASLAATAFAPSATASQNRLVVPPTTTLSLTAFPPGAVAPQTARPDTVGLGLTAVAPAVATPRLATPPPAGLLTTTAEPVVSGAGGSGVVATPTPAALAIATFGPGAIAPRVSVPGPASIALTGRIPAVAAPRLVTVGVAGMLATGRVPNISAPVVARPTPGTLATSSFAVVVSGGGVTIGGPAPRPLGEGTAAVGLAIHGRPDTVAIHAKPR